MPNCSEKSRRRILFVTRNFPPLTGGMERLNYQAVLALQKKYSVALCGPRGARSFLPGNEFVKEVSTRSLSSFLFKVQWQALLLACSIRPHVVYSGSGLSAPAALLAARATRAHAVCYLHGLDIVADHWIYRKIFLSAIREFDQIIVNSVHTAKLAEVAGVNAQKISVLHPGVDLPGWLSRKLARREFRAHYGLTDRPVLLAAGRLTERKGLVEFLGRSLTEVRKKHPNVLLLIIGSEATQALKHRQGIEQRIRETVKSLDLESNVLMLGSVSDQVLSDAYYSSDVLVFPVLDLPGDVEGFGMVAVEAAAHGLPTVAFAVGGVPDAVSNGLSGSLIPAGDYQEFTRQVLASLDSPNMDSVAESCRNFAEKFDWRNFERQLCETIELGK